MSLPPPRLRMVDVLMIAACALVVWPRINQTIVDRDDATATSQRLDDWDAVKKLLQEHVPENEIIQYTCAVDKQGEPLYPNVEDYLAAIIAPRRLSKKQHSKYVIAAIGRKENLPNAPHTKGTKLVTNILPGVVLLERQQTP